ncbi:MAG: acyl-CoA dehydrogenase [Candidatus Abyssobacteria bacterium SURF_17]|uniref:Acyl-CoA dehydrogenase n=1 Tax=Candidatus Abyssobacteria bacterium SURF_17 TaxID=2093361 RepID=A0A419ETW9_9BACT|nr:MAG: acyl-CoA dehydrogenase [Candidatus Abyssubacteria bacterium SURF_17]
MDFSLPDELHQLRASLRHFIGDELLPRERESRFDEDTELPQKLMDWARKRAVELGFYGMLMPREVGGGGLGHVGMVVLKEEIGRSGSYLGQLVLGDAGGPSRLLVECSDHVHQSYLLPSMRAEKISCFALSEPNAGSDAASIETTAVRDGDSYVLNGTKHMVSHGAHADYAIVFAVTNKALRARGGISCFLVDMDSPGLRITRRHRPMGGFTEPVEIVFEDCAVPASHLVGPEGFGFVMAMRWLADGRLAMAATAVGTAELLLQSSTNHANRSSQSTRARSERSSIRNMLAEMATELYAARGMLYDTAWRADNGMDMHRECSMTKLFATEMVNRAADAALQIHGAASFESGCLVERIFRDVRAMRIGEGTSEIHRMIIAKSLLRET